MVHRSKSRSRSKELRSLQPSLSKKNKSKSRSKKRISREDSTKHSFDKSKRSSLHSLPLCKPTFYCGAYKELPKFSDYDKMGSKEECFKKGIGVGMMIELNKVKNKLAKKGIILVTKPFEKSKCMDKNGNIKMQ